MKKIEAVIKPFRLENVRDVFRSFGIGITATEIKREEPSTIGSFDSQTMMPKIKVEAVLDETQHDIDKIIADVMQAAATGREEDGELRVFDVDTVVAIRTGTVTGKPLANLAAG